MYQIVFHIEQKPEIARTVVRTYISSVHIVKLRVGYPDKYYLIRGINGDNAVNELIQKRFPYGFIFYIKLFQLLSVLLVKMRPDKRLAARIQYSVKLIYRCCRRIIKIHYKAVGPVIGEILVIPLGKIVVQRYNTVTEVLFIYLTTLSVHSKLRYEQM